MKTRDKLSALWIVVMFNMVYADILSLVLVQTGRASVVAPAGLEITQGFMLAMAAFIEIPILMTVLSRILSNRASRWANVVAAPVTSLFVIGGGSGDWHYIFFASVELACLVAIIGLAWAGTSDDARPLDTAAA